MFDVNIAEWLSLILRWAHITAGIAWIGSSFYFMFTDASLRPHRALDDRAHGETWQVHGGGFYHIVKYLVSPDRLPSTLHWFKYEAYFTWLTGFFLLSVVYYYRADAFLIDPAVMDLTPSQAIFLSVLMLGLGWVVYDTLCKSRLGARTGLLALLVFLLVVGAAWAFAEVFGGRAAYVHAGAFIGTIMVGNVFFIIIPNQKKVVQALRAGETPDPALGGQAKQRSVHNNYLTLPVLLMMVSSHYPMTYGHSQSWLVFALILVIGGLVRHYYNSRNAGVEAWWMRALYPAAAVLMLGLILFVSWRPAPDVADVAASTVTDKEAFAIVRQHCLACHADTPTHPDWDEAPAGVMFDTLEQLRARRDAVYQQTVIARAMPLGNDTRMTEDERMALGRWVDGQGPYDDGGRTTPGAGS